MESSRNAWLMKAEPEPRIVKDHEAKNLMKEKMKKGDHVLFYHSNCKAPGIAGIAEIEKEGYPDFTAFDSSHPYFDPKSIENKPTWFMNLVNGKANAPEYLSSEDLQAIKNMPLLNRGRLSVQPVSLEAFEAIKNLGVNGGWPSIEKGSSTSKPTSTLPGPADHTQLTNAQSSKRKSPSRTIEARRSKRTKK